MEVDCKVRTTLGVDIGGANVKLADPVGRSLTVAFPMWTDFNRLGESLRALLDQFEREFGISPSRLAVTMTGELADCFPTRRVGVEHILDQVAIAFPMDKTSVYAVDGRWLSPVQAQQSPWKVAASNWHALATWAHLIRLGDQYDHNLKYAPQAIIDVGSTTVDIIPLDNNGVATAATTDRERLQLGQLVYTGMQRTPVAAILSHVVLQGTKCPLMAERFATSDDPYVALGLVGEVAEDRDTADGQPRTKHCARARLARMVGEDVETLDIQTIESIADQVIDAQAAQVAAAIARNVDLCMLQASTMTDGQQLEQSARLPVLLLSGHGRPLIQRVAERLKIAPHRFLWIEDAISQSAARAAPAMAVAWLLDNCESPAAHSAAGHF